MKNHILLLILYFFSSFLFTHAQDLLKKDSILRKEYQNQELTAKLYLYKTGQLIDENADSGNFLAHKQLVSVLDLYKKLAWSSDSLSMFRINYFIMLSNNADESNRAGESIYYLEKAEQQVKQIFNQKPILVAGYKCNLYRLKKNYKEVLDSYDQVKDYMSEFPKLLATDAIHLNIASSYINVLYPVVESYANLKDTTRLLETIKLAEDIHRIISVKLKAPRPTLYFCNFYHEAMYYQLNFKLYGDFKKTKIALQKMKSALNDTARYMIPLHNTLKVDFQISNINYFLDTKNNDSAAHYIHLLKKNKIWSGENRYDLNRFESILKGNLGLYKDAHKAALQAASTVDSIQNLRMSDIDRLLYAYVDSEENAIAIKEMHEREAKHIQYIIGISILVISIFLMYYKYVDRKNKKNRELIKKLNDQARIQIAVLEEVKTTIRDEEQKKIAQELHDNLAGTLATLKYRINSLDELVTDDSSRSNMETIKLLLEKAYQETRQKSHYLFDNAQGEKYNEHIRFLIKTALPKKQFDSQIEIEDEALINLSIDIRINLLRIIHESLVNIIKHSHAHTVKLVIYQEMNSLIVHIEDNGKGFHLHKIPEKSVGLKSLKQRIESLHGTLTLHSKINSGTEITISIPL